MRAIYVNPTFTKRINELSEEESRSVLDYLFRVQIENHGECAYIPSFQPLSWTTVARGRKDVRADLLSPIAEDHVKYKWNKYDVAIWNNSVSPAFRPLPGARIRSTN